MKTSSVSVRDYLRLVFRRKWSLVLPALAGVLIVGPLWVVTPPKYRAASVVRRRDLSVLRRSPSALISREFPRISIAALEAEILAWPNLEQVIRKVKEDVGLTTASDWQRKYEELREAISIRAIAQGGGVDIIQIAVITESASRAQEIANAVADIYVEKSKTTAHLDSQRAVQFLDDGAQDYLKKLREAEDELDEYRQEHFADLPDVKNAILSRLLTLRIDETAQKLQLTETSKSLEEMEKQLAEIPRTITSEVTSEENPRAIELQDQLARNKRLLSAMLLRYTEEHPTVQQVRTEIAAMEQELAETPQRVSGTELEAVNPVYQDLFIEQLNLRRQIKAGEATLVAMRSQVSANEQELRELVSEEKDYTDLSRKIREYSELYGMWQRSLAAARTRLEVDAGEYGTEVEMLERALEPSKPYHIPRLKMLFVCILGGVAAGVALMFSLEFCDRSFRDMEDAAAFLEMPILGSICSIVLPREVGARRRKRLVVAGVAVGTVLLALAGVYFWGRLPPGTREHFVEVVKQVAGRLVD